MYTGDGDYQHSRLGRWSKIFAEASPPLIPGMLVVKDSGEHAFPTLETMPLDLWSNLTVLIMKNVGGYIPAYSQPLPLWRFPRLQHLAVAAKTPELEEPTSESKDIEPPLFPSLIHLTVIISGGQNVWNWAAALPYFPNLKTLGLYGFTYSGPEEPKVLNLPSVESFTLSPASRIPEEYPVRTRMPSLKHATFFAPDTNRIIEEVLDPVNFQEMISSWPQLEHLSLIGSATQLGWPDHLNAVKGHLPPSLRSIRMLWDLKRESMPEKWAGKYTDMARDAAIACLRAYKEQHGRPLSLWEYAVTPDSSAPPELLGTADDANERLLLEYRIVTNHVCGDDARPEDNPFLLCGKSTH
ncbi:hypothetical protein DL93DRAFT_1835565 [Clavulina sp. PMI_390]|nr:hypothetical protein DL93DRAFT_1835565 [Clavulina sp. PMI_390]